MELTKDELLKKYEENVYLIGQIFSNDEIVLSDEDSDSALGEEDEPMPEGPKVAATPAPAEKPAAATLPETGDQQRAQGLAEERKGLEAAYQRIFAEQQSLEKYQDEELDNFENANKDFHQLLHDLKQAKLRPHDIEEYIKKAKELAVFADTHPALMVLEGQSPRQAQRPFSDSDHVEYIKL